MGSARTIQTQSLSTDSPDEVVAGDPQLSFFILVRFPPPASMPMSSDGEVNSTAVYDQLDRKLNSFEIVTDQMGLRMGHMKGLASFDSLNVSIGRGLIGADVSPEGVLARRVLDRADHATWCFVVRCRGLDGAADTDE